MSEPGDQLIWKLPFTVKDEDSVDWNARLTAFDGRVAIDLYRFEPGKRVARDIASMSPDEAMEMAKGLMLMAQKAAEQVVEEVHDR